MYLLFITSFVISCSGCATISEHENNGDSGFAVAKKANAQVEIAQETAELESADTIVGASDMSGTSSTQAMSDSSTEITDSNIDYSTIKQVQ